MFHKFCPESLGNLGMISPVADFLDSVSVSRSVMPDSLWLRKP